MPTLQPPSIQPAEFDIPETDRFATHGDASLVQEVFYIAMAEIEAIVEPDGIGNDVSWESVALICVHPSILVQITDLTCQYRI